MLPILDVGPLALPMRELLFVMSLWPIMELMTRLAYRRAGQPNAAAYASNFGDFGLLWHLMMVIQVVSGTYHNIPHIITMSSQEVH